MLAHNLTLSKESRKRKSVHFKPYPNKINNVSKSPRTKKSRISDDFLDRRILKMAAAQRYIEGSPEQLTAIRTALTSPVAKDETVIKDTLNALENNLTHPSAKAGYKRLLRAHPELWHQSIFWDRKTELLSIELYSPPMPTN